jgi:hypothetical protein
MDYWDILAAAAGLLSMAVIAHRSGGAAIHGRHRSPHLETTHVCALGPKVLELDRRMSLLV